jgi:hypothetical protein
MEVLDEKKKSKICRQVEVNTKKKVPIKKNHSRKISSLDQKGRVKNFNTKVAAVNEEINLISIHFGDKQKYFT